MQTFLRILVAALLLPTIAGCHGLKEALLVPPTDPTPSRYYEKSGIELLKEPYRTRAKKMDFPEIRKQVLELRQQEEDRSESN